MVSCRLDISAWKQTATTDEYLFQDGLPAFAEMTVIFWFEGEADDGGSYDSYVFSMALDQSKCKIYGFMWRIMGIPLNLFYHHFRGVYGSLANTNHNNLCLLTNVFLLSVVN